ncbi:E3 ubiquitin-protein ligase TRIM71-like [Stylophora pistillata]|uniref:E3 ubiquitin-protein ligase TRIM71-like n=1 Tax=Stylophora pistillata TaxID=50429 RepID=UPI000C04039F|nr:E3 ubiquitin-protein ligase TRIM71-like [Stylophora pistillata]
MAQSSIIAGVIVEDISRHLNCRLCRRLIRTPKLLPCLHSFCQVCIQGFAEKLAPSEFLACPLCETDAKISKEELEDLPTNFFLDNMLDIALINSSDREPVPCSNCDSLNSPATSRCVDCGEFLCLNCYNVHKRIRQTKEHRILTISELLASKTGEDLHRPAFCRIHHSEPLKYYCETCNEAVCRDCVLIEHRQHKYDYIKDSKKIQKQKAIMENLFEECSANIPFLEKSIKEIQGISDTLRGRLAAVKAEIREATLHQIKVLKEKERKLLMEADKIYNAKSPILKRQKDQLQDEYTKFKTGCDFSEQVLKYANEVELLSLKTLITERLTELNNTQLDCKPHENSELKYEVNTKEAETVVAHSLGILKTSGPHLVLEDIEEAPKMNGRTNGYSEENATREVPLSVELRDPNGVLLPPDTIHQADGQSFSAYHPFFNGIFSFSVFIRGQVVEGFPQDINIGDIRPRVRSAKRAIAGSGSKFGRLGDPQGVAVSQDGNVIVSDSRNHRLQVFDMDGNFRFLFGAPGSRDGHFQFPSGVAVTTEGDIVVADTMNNRIQIFTKDGKFIKKFGKETMEGERLYQPYGVAVDNQGRIFVVDRGKARVVVFNEKGQVLFTFGSLGDGRGQFNCPSAVAVNSKGHVIITDFGNDRVQVFGSKGQFLFKFGKSGKADGELNWPTGVVTDADDHIIVSDSYNHRIQMFNEDGSFMTRFGSEGSKRGQFKRPEGVAVTKQGNIIVADWGNDRIQVF